MIERIKAKLAEWTRVVLEALASCGEALGDLVESVGDIGSGDSGGGDCGGGGD